MFTLTSGDVTQPSEAEQPLIIHPYNYKIMALLSDNLLQKHSSSAHICLHKKKKKILTDLALNCISEHSPENLSEKQQALFKKWKKNKQQGSLICSPVSSCPTPQWNTVSS